MPAPDDVYAAATVSTPALERPPTVLRTGARWSIALVTGSALMYLLLGLTALMIIIRGGERVPSGTLSPFQIGAIFQFGLFIASGIVFPVWLSRANRRLRALGREGMQFTPGWSVGWFFIPFANFVMPTAVVQDLWRASASDPSPTGWKVSPKSSLVNAWWSLFIIGNLISRIGLGISTAGEPVGALVGDALSSFLIVTAAVCLVILIRRIEFRVTTLEAAMSAEGATVPAPAAPAVFPGIAGTAVGIVVGAGWALLSFPLFGLLGVRFLHVPLMLLTGVCVGIIVGYWTLLGAGGRRGVFAVVAGIGAFLAMLKGGVLTSAGFLASALRGSDSLRPVLGWFGGLLTDPLVCAAGILAAGAAVAVTLIRLPIDLWLPGRVLKAPAVAPMPAPVAPMLVTAPPPVAERPIAHLEPTPVAPVPAAEPYVAVAPQPLIVESPTPKTEPPQPREPFNLREFLTHNRVAVIIVGIILLIMACSCCGTGAFLLGRGILEGQGAAPTIVPAVEVVPEAPQAGVPERPEAITPESPVAQGVPEDVVVALYQAASRGDNAAARSTWAYPSDLDPGVLAAWGDPDWEIVLVTAGDSPGDLLVEVSEPDGGFSDWETVTYIMREFDDGWLITGWSLGTVQEYRDRSGN